MGLPQAPTALGAAGSGAPAERSKGAVGSPHGPQRVRYHTFAEDQDGDVVFYFFDPRTGERRRSSPICDITKLNYCCFGRPDADNLGWYRIETLSGSYYAVLMPKKHVAEIVEMRSRARRARPASETRLEKRTRTE